MSMQLWAEINGAVDAFGNRCFKAGVLRGQEAGDTTSGAAAASSSYFTWRVEDT